jgi:hypothetical protein
MDTLDWYRLVGVVPFKYLLTLGQEPLIRFSGFFILKSRFLPSYSFWGTAKYFYKTFGENSRHEMLRGFNAGLKEAGAIFSVYVPRLIYFPNYIKFKYEKYHQPEDSLPRAGNVAGSL